MKPWLSSTIIGILITLPSPAMPFTPMSAMALKATTGQAARQATPKNPDELLEAYYALFAASTSGIQEGEIIEAESLANGEQFGDMGIFNWAFRLLNAKFNRGPSIFSAIHTFNASISAEPDRDESPVIPNVIVEIPHLIIIVPKGSYTVMLNATDGPADDQDFLKISHEASLMAIHSGIIEIAAH